METGWRANDRGWGRRRAGRNVLAREVVGETFGGAGGDCHCRQRGILLRPGREAAAVANDNVGDIVKAVPAVECPELGRAMHPHRTPIVHR